MYIAQPDTLFADSAVEPVYLVRWKDIHNRKAVSSRQVLITFFPPCVVYSHISFREGATPKICAGTLNFYCGL